jgi:hypothetical protein
MRITEKINPLDALLTSFKLSDPVYFPTRVQNESATALTIHILILVNLEITLYLLPPLGCLSTAY